MTKKHYLHIFISFLILFVSHSVHAQQDSSVHEKPTSYGVGSLFVLKQKIANNPSLGLFTIFFDHIDQLKKTKYTIKGIEIFPVKYQKQMSKQFRNGVGILLELLDNPEKESRLIKKLEKITENLDDIMNAAEDKSGVDYSGAQLKIEFLVPK